MIKWDFRNHPSIQFLLSGQLDFFSTAYLGFFFWLRAEHYGAKDGDNGTITLYALELFAFTGMFCSLSHRSLPHAERQTIY